jgi:hypothetical protein
MDDQSVELPVVLRGARGTAGMGRHDPGPQALEVIDAEHAGLGGIGQGRDGPCRTVEKGHKGEQSLRAVVNSEIMACAPLRINVPIIDAGPGLM